MIKLKVCFVLSISLLMAGCGSVSTASAAPNQVSPQGAESVIGKLLGKDRDQIEAVLGKPEKSGTNQESGSDWSEYRLQNTKGVRVLYFSRGGGLPKTASGEIDVSFDKLITWQKAAEALGLKSGDLKAAPDKDIPSMTLLSGHPFKGWNVLFAGPNAHYPGGTNMINENGGLPELQFQQQSINDNPHV